MQTIKTAAVVVVLVAVLYAVYVVLNKPPAPLPREIQWEQAELLAPLDIEVGAPAESAWGNRLGRTESEEAGSAQPPPATTVVERESGASRAETAGARALEASDTAAAGDPWNRDQPSAPSIADAPASPPAADRGTELPGLPDVARATGQGSDPGAGAWPPGQDSEPAEPAARGSGSRAFQSALETAETQIRSGHWNEALFTLSLFYENRRDLTADEQRHLLDLLDPLAAKVIYSREHLLEPAYEVRRGESLQDIAERYQVPWQLLQKVNGLARPDALVAGTQLKVVEGPFRAVVELDQRQLTLFLGRLYAGRFPITTGDDPPPEPGQYEVRDKQQDRAYYTASGRVIAGDDPRNPYGGWWIDLGRELCIHGAAVADAPEDAALGCIRLSPLDASDVYDILSNRSRVTIR